MSAVYREFPLRSPSVWPNVVAFVKANAQALADQGTPLRLIFTTDEKKRNAEQNRYYWGAVLRPIAEQAYAAGRQFDKDTWHEFFARKFGVCEDMTLPDGEVIIRRKSTTEMSVHEFSEYITQVQVYAAQELGVELI